MFPEYQDYLKTLPPNPPYAQVQAEQQKQIEEQNAAIRQGKGQPAAAPTAPSKPARR
jgi:hypothetical protein